MIKIVFLLSLIYYISCQSESDSECSQFTKVLGDQPQKASQCTALKASSENRKCCFFELKCPDDSDASLNICRELPKDADISQEIDKLESEGGGPVECTNAKVNIKCEDGDEINNPSYLKIGILLILCLLF